MLYVELPKRRVLSVAARLRGGQAVRHGRRAATRHLTERRRVLQTRRASLFAVLVAGCVLAGRRDGRDRLHARDSSEAASAGASDALPAARAAKRPTIVFRSTAHHGQLAIAAAGRQIGGADPLGAALRSRLLRRRPRAVPGARRLPGRRPRRGLRPRPARAPHGAASRASPSRARVSPDGRYGAVTLFVTGHAYDPGLVLDADDDHRPRERAEDRRPRALHRRCAATDRSPRSTSTSGASPSRATATASTPRSRPAERRTSSAARFASAWRA